IAVAHFHAPVEDDEYLLAVVHVPPVGPVGPVQAGGDAVHAGDVDGAPRTVGLESVAADDLDAFSSIRAHRGPAARGVARGWHRTPGPAPRRGNRRRAPAPAGPWPASAAAADRSWRCLPARARPRSSCGAGRR